MENEDPKVTVEPAIKVTLEEVTPEQAQTEQAMADFAKQFSEPVVGFFAPRPR